MIELYYKLLFFKFPLNIFTLIMFNSSMTFVDVILSSGLWVNIFKVKSVRGEGFTSRV